MRGLWSVVLFGYASLVWGARSQLSVDFGLSGQGGFVGSVMVGKTTCFDLDSNTATFVNGEWHSQSNRSLTLTSRKEDRGMDQYGRFSRTTLTWGLTERVPAFSTEVRSYPTESVAIFTTRVLSKPGLLKTNHSGSGSMLKFPSIRIGSGQTDTKALCCLLGPKGRVFYLDR